MTLTRKEAIDILKNTIVRFGRTNGKTAYAEALQMAIKALKEPKWIPCSERLPSSLEWDEKYLVSLAWGGIGVMEYKSTGFHNYGSFNPVPIETVTAWMPLPSPYQAERRTDE